MTVKLFIEGGGDAGHLESLFRRGWGRFFGAAGLQGRMPGIVRGGSREQTFRLFRVAVEQPRPDLLPVLLVDSEEAVDEGGSVWQHLARHDRWVKPVDARSDQAFLMVQVMETWFLADRDCLKRYFGSGFQERRLRRWPALERVPKMDVLSALAGATAGCGKQYAKGKISFELLGELNPGVVGAACPHAKTLLDFLRSRDEYSGMSQAARLPAR